VSESSPNYGGSYLLNAIQAFQQRDSAGEGPRDELQQYLSAGVESTKDVLGWWGVSPAFNWGGLSKSDETRATPDILL
jgi:hypothetical protein